MRSLGRQFDSFRGELAARHPAFPADSGAAIKAHDGPITEPLVYSAEDDQAIATWVRKNVGTSWHSMGTCPMKAREHGGVVDARLDVYGVKGLKVTGELRMAKSRRTSPDPHRHVHRAVQRWGEYRPDGFDNRREGGCSHPGGSRGVNDVDDRTSRQVRTSAGLRSRKECRCMGSVKIQLMPKAQLASSIF